MKNTITITVAPEKLSALTMYMKQKNTSAEAELEKYAEQLYQKNVPQKCRGVTEVILLNLKGCVETYAAFLFLS